MSVYFYLCTHPIQAAQVLDLVLVIPSFVVDDCMLLIHAAGLQTKKWRINPVVTV